VSILSAARLSSKPLLDALHHHVPYHLARDSSGCYQQADDFAIMAVQGKGQARDQRGKSVHRPRLPAFTDIEAIFVCRSRLRILPSRDVTAITVRFSFRAMTCLFMPASIIAISLRSSSGVQGGQQVSDLSSALECV
jgi:hypothetical protein